MQAAPPTSTDARPDARPGLRALVVDDEAPALSELLWLLDQDPRIVELHSAASGTQALRVLDSAPIDVIFCDIKMPGLDGLDLARVLGRFAERPQIVFVTAYDAHAVDAFDLRVTDYVLKPVRAERLTEAVRLVADRQAAPERAAFERAATGQSAPRSPAPRSPALRSPAARSAPRSGSRPGPWPGTPRPAAERLPGERIDRSAPDRTGHDTPDDETIAVELGGVTRFVQRSQVTHVEAHGDYARLHTVTGSHLVRIPLSVLEERWATAGFVRIHRSTLVAVTHVDEIRIEAGRCAVRLGDHVLQVSRRHTKDLRDRLVRAASLTRER